MNDVKNILLIDDSRDVREVIAVNLETQGYTVTEANDGAEGLNLLDKEKWYCIICDLQMPHISGLMFLKIIRERGLKIPLIFITGFNNIIETEQAFRMGAQAFITKPFEDEELFQKLKDVESYSTLINRPETEIELDDYYCKVHIDEFVMGKKIVYPIFLKLSSAKYIKIAHSGEDLDQKKIEGIKKHGVEYFYLTNEDFKNYLKRNVQIAQNLLKFPQIAEAKKRDFFIGITKNLIEYEFNRDINPETISMSLFAIHNTLLFVSKKGDFLKAIESLHDLSPTMIEHSILVSMLASAIALQSEEFNIKTVDVVALAALFHDFGMKELPKSLLGKEVDEMDPEELKLYKTHPQLSSQLLSSMEEVPEAVYQAVLAHHELCDGSGYPFGIGKVKIHPIARVIALANYLAETWSKEGNQTASFKSIVASLADKRDLYDPQYIDTCLELVNGKSGDKIIKTTF